MSPSNRQPARGERGNLYQEVTDKIVSELEQGRFPWVQSWGNASAALGLPKNAATARRYSGINVLVLWSALHQKGYRGQNWLTFRQAVMLGGSVCKGERGTTVFYADTFIPKGERERAAKDGDDPNAVPFLKRHTVFNVEQCDGLPASAFDGIAPLPEREIIPRAEALIKATGAEIRIGGNRAFYHTVDDYIQLPPQQSFFDQINFYNTAYHELGHWAGAAHRLNRDYIKQDAAQGRYREELCAELTAAFVCAALGIVPTERHADYLGHFVDLLKEDNRAIFRAASHASKAADFILAFEAGVDAQSEAA